MIRDCGTLLQPHLQLVALVCTQCHPVRSAKKNKLLVIQSYCAMVVNGKGQKKQCSCVCGGEPVRAHMHARTRLSACLSACLPACLRCVHACLRAGVRACSRPHARMHIRGYLSECMCVFAHVLAHMRLYACVCVCAGGGGLVLAGDSMCRCACVFQPPRCFAIYKKLGAARQIQRPVIKSAAGLVEATPRISCPCASNAKPASSNWSTEPALCNSQNLQDMRWHW